MDPLSIHSQIYEQAVISGCKYYIEAWLCLSYDAFRLLEEMLKVRHSKQGLGLGSKRCADLTVINAHQIGLVTTVSTMVPGGGLVMDGPALAKNLVLILFFTTTIATLGLKLKWLD